MLRVAQTLKQRSLWYKDPIDPKEPENLNGIQAELGLARSSLPLS